VVEQGKEIVTVAGKDYLVEPALWCVHGAKAYRPSGFRWLS